jgi:hypothetical protein
LRRAALRVTQRAITERLTVTKAQVSVWERMVTALTDDYVLHGDVGALLEPVKAALRIQPEQRDPGELERQVRANIASFQLQLQAANDRAGVVPGVMFGCRRQRVGPDRQAGVDPCWISPRSSSSCSEQS